MNHRGRAITLIVIQCLVVSSIAAKYLYQRMTCPRVWVQVVQYDPNLPMRGRYLAMSPIVNACGLARDEEAKSSSYQDETTKKQITVWEWRVQTKANDGKLVVEDARNVLPRNDTEMIRLGSNQNCSQSSLAPAVDYFIPDTAKSPFPLKPGTKLWAEVTVPPKGPPRPIQLAISENGQWRPLALD